MFLFSIRKLSDIQAPTLLNNGTQYSSVANNNCDIVENSILECISVNADRDVLNAADLINSNQIEKIHSDNSAFREIINKELMSKMCLRLSEELSARITWCAILVFWVELYKNAENYFLK